MKTWMKIAAVPVVVILVAVLTVYVWGSMLPLAHVASRSVQLARPAEEVWAVITGFENTPSWRPEVSSVVRRVDDEGREVFVETNDYGEFAYRVEESVPTERLVTCIVDHPDFGGCWTYEISPTPEGCQLTITEAGEIYSPVFRFFGEVVFGLDATINSYLDALSEHMAG